MARFTAGIITGIIAAIVWHEVLVMLSQVSKEMGLPNFDPEPEYWSNA